MPIYEYECKKCRSRFEMKRSFGEDGSAKCPECRGKAYRIFTSVPVIFKGSGFYVTDSRSPGETQLPAKIPETTKAVTVPKEASTTKEAAV